MVGATLTAAPSAVAAPMSAKRAPTAAADLHIASLAAPAAVAVGGSFRSSARTRNAGRAHAAASTTALYLSADARLDPKDLRLASHAVPRLKAKSAHTRRRALRLPTLVKPGRYRLLACADARFQVRESSERNNCRTAKRSTRVTAAGGVLGQKVTAPVPASTPALAPAALRLSHADAYFGAVSIGAASGALTLAVTNTGGLPSGPVGTELVGAHANDFEISASSCTAVLAGGASCTMRVTFVPAHPVGPKSASLQVSGAPGGTASAALSGLADPAALAITPPAREFGAVLSGLSSGAFGFTVTNTGLVTTSLATALGGANADQFAISSTACADTLGPGESCALEVTFSPTGTAGPRSAALEVSGHPGGTTTAALSGSARPAPALSLSATSADFGEVVLGTMGGTTVVTVTNGGEAPSGVLGAALAGNDQSEFTITANACTVALAPGASCDVAIAFSPTGSPGARSALLQVSGSPGGTVTVTLAGLAVPRPATLAMTPVAREFGTVASGSVSGEFTFTVTNTGDVASGTMSASLAGSDAAQFTITANTCSGVLPAGAGCTVRAAFNPTGAAGSRSAELRIAASPGGTATSTLTGSAA